MNTKATNALQTLCDTLDSIGVSYDTDRTFGPIQSVLRSSWYVDKAVSLGHTHCCHVDISSGGFIAVLEDGTMMTGSNVMCPNAIENICDEIDYNLWTEILSDAEDIYGYTDDNRLVLDTGSFCLYSKDLDYEDNLMTFNGYFLDVFKEKVADTKEWQELSKKVNRVLAEECVYELLPF